MLLLSMYAQDVCAATITYSLSRHTLADGDANKIITASATLNAGASLLDNMPQALWRAYCTYKFYSNPAMTTEITEAPSSDATVYVDYVFDPPFILSSEDGDPIWHYIRTYNSSSNNYVMYLQKQNYPNSTKIHGWKNSAPASVNPTGNSSGQMMYPGDADWAFYGDAYDLHIRINNDDSSLGNKRWLIWTSTSSAADLALGARQSLGWQLYVNKTERQDNSYNWYDYYTMALNVPNTNLYAYLENNNYALRTSTLTSDYRLDSKHQIEGKTTTSQVRRNMWWYGFYATPVGSGKDLNYHVTYRILMHDGNWYSDIVKPQTNSSNTKLRISFPTEYEKKAYCTYDMFYKDEAFTEKYPDPYQMPNTENLVVYIKEVLGNAEPFITDRWITLVISYQINDVASEFNNGVRVLEYVGLESDKTGSRFDLKFQQTNTMLPHVPYLFKADETLEGEYMILQKSTNEEQEEWVLRESSIRKFQDTRYENSPTVSMIGTYVGKELTPQSESEHPGLLYFYFGYDGRYDKNSASYVGDENAEGKYAYNFYRVTKKNATISKHHCYFQIEGSATQTSGAKFLVTGFNNGVSEIITGIDGIQTEPEAYSGSIYNMNGQMVSKKGSVAGLPKGLYIVNGKKVIVK